MKGKKGLGSNKEPQHGGSKGTLIRAFKDKVLLIQVLSKAWDKRKSRDRRRVKSRL